MEGLSGQLPGLAGHGAGCYSCATESPARALVGFAPWGLGLKDR